MGRYFGIAKFLTVILFGGLAVQSHASSPRACMKGTTYLEPKLADFLKKIKDPDRSEGAPCKVCPPVVQFENYFLFPELVKAIDAQQVEADGRCIELAHSLVRPSEMVECKGKTPIVHSKKFLPCVSDTYLEVYGRVMRAGFKCTEISGEDFFPLFVQETGASPMSRGPVVKLKDSERAIGMGQVLPSTVETIATMENTNPTLQEINRNIQTNDKCKIFRNVRTPKKVSRLDACEMRRFSVDGPFLEVLISMKYLAMRRQAIEDGVPATLKTRYNNEELKKLILHATYYDYHSGMNGSALLFAYAQTRPPLEPIDKVLAGFPRFIEKKRPVMASYVQPDGERFKHGIETLKKTLREDSGKACFKTK